MEEDIEVDAGGGVRCCMECMKETRPKIENFIKILLFFIVQYIYKNWVLTCLIVQMLAEINICTKVHLCIDLMDCIQCGSSLQHRKSVFPVPYESI